MRISWQKQIQSAVTDPKELFLELKLDLSLIEKLFPRNDILISYPLKVPRSFIRRMQKGDINDPLLQQILPVQSEAESIPGFRDDPLGEHKLSIIPGLIHKYYGRVLVLVTSNCAINCRFCFRRFCRQEAIDLQKILTYIANEQTIEEVIFSGGEPLLLENTNLENLLQEFSKISHVKRVRIHTRLPILIPDRVDHGLIKALRSSRLNLVVVVHTNHPLEISNDVLVKLRLLQSKNILLLNQSVLLKNINDNADTLIALSQRLCAAGVLPYYLHLLDKVTGAHHFSVDVITAQKIYADMTAKLPGYLLPRMVRDVEGSNAKALIL